MGGRRSKKVVLARKRFGEMSNHLLLILSLRLRKSGTNWDFVLDSKKSRRLVILCKSGNDISAVVNLIESKSGQERLNLLNEPGKNGSTPYVKYSR